MVGDSSVSVGVAACGVSVRFRGRIQDFSWGGAPLRNDVTDKWRKQMLQNISYITKLQVIWGASGLRTPCTVPLDPPLIFKIKRGLINI